MEIPAALYGTLGVVIALQLIILYTVSGISRRVNRLTHSGEGEGEEQQPHVSRRRSSSREEGRESSRKSSSRTPEAPPEDDFSRYDGSHRPEIVPSEDELEANDRSGTEQGRHFAEFLNEDPSRMELPKKEQFAAFRRWRAAKGLNWRGN